LSEKQQLAYYALHLANSPIEEVLYGGAAFGGKTLLGSIFQLSRRIQYPNTRGFIARENHTDLINSTFKTFTEVYNKIALPRIGEMKYNGQEKCIRFPNGSEILLMYTSQRPGDPENQRFGSYEFTDGFCDEVGEMNQNAVDILSSRIRFNLINKKPALLLCSNPARGWLKERYIADEHGAKSILKNYQLYIQAKVSDNPDKEKAERYTKTISRLPEFHRKRLLDGDWDYQVDDYDFCSDGKLIKITECDINPYHPIVLSFDFNHNPTTCHINQKVSERISEGGGIYTYKTFMEKGGTENLCLHLLPFIEKIYDEGFKSSILVTGDHNGTYHTSSSGNVNDFMIIQKVLGLPTNNFINTTRVNPKHVYSRTLINYLFKSELVTIHPQCVELINDIKKAKATDKGGLYKDRDSGHSMDALDAYRYGLHSMFESTRDIDKWIYAIG
jgi:hypothetical protein